MSVPPDIQPHELNQYLISQAKKDIQTVGASSLPQHHLPHGSSFRPLPTHVDDRGSVMELYDPRWNWHPSPLLFSYCFTVRPGVVKGWGIHEQHEDRYVLLQGEVDLVMYDVRPNSPTFGLVSVFHMNTYNRGIINIPAFVWHADHNVGNTDALVVNFPTIEYDHNNPDKYRLPIDTPLIPYDFGGARGG